jgi:glutathione peroxidase-family protein
VSNYDGLNALASQFGADGLAIIGTPCGQFDDQ